MVKEDRYMEAFYKTRAMIIATSKLVGDEMLQKSYQIMIEFMDFIDPDKNNRQKFLEKKGK